ncbi:MAG: DUF4251 domain-containing protein [Algicola sp.]|nr:DUF4251 domain-containing protein [Algicola sp.]
MKFKITSLFIVILLCVSCGSSKTNATPEQIKKLDALVANQSFQIESDWAYPQATMAMVAIQNAGILPPGDNASRINLHGNPNELVLKGEKVSSKLPYYGEVQMPSGYNGSDNGSISFEGTVEDYTVVQNDNHSYKISFKAMSNNENFNVSIVLYPNLKSDILLQGSKRFPIRYIGKVKPFTTE